MSVESIKAAIFDKLKAIENLQLQANQLVAEKNELLKQLEAEPKG